MLYPFLAKLAQNAMDSGFRCGPCGVSDRFRVTAARNCVSRNGRTNRFTVS